MCDVMYSVNKSFQYCTRDTLLSNDCYKCVKGREEGGGCVWVVVRDLCAGEEGDVGVGVRGWKDVRAIFFSHY